MRAEEGWAGCENAEQAELSDSLGLTAVCNLQKSSYLQVLSMAEGDDGVPGRVNNSMGTPVA